MGVEGALLLGSGVAELGAGACEGDSGTCDCTEGAVVFSLELEVLFLLAELVHPLKSRAKIAVISASVRFIISLNPP